MSNYTIHFKAEGCNISLTTATGQEIVNLKCDEITYDGDVKNLSELVKTLCLTDMEKTEKLKEAIDHLKNALCENGEPESTDSDSETVETEEG